MGGSPGRARLGVDLRLVAGGAWTVARWLGFKTVVATVGTRDGQNLGLMQAGGRRVSGVGPTVTPKYDDEVAVMGFALPAQHQPPRH